MMFAAMSLYAGIAAAQPAQGTLQSLEAQYIDLKNIITDPGNVHKVYISFGKHVFQGELHNDNLTLSAREIYDIAHRVMDEMGIPEGFFGRVKYDQEEWERTNGALDWGLIVGDALTMAGVIPGHVGTAAGIAADAINYYRGQTSGSDVTASQASNLGTAALGYLGKQQTGAGVLASAAGDIMGAAGSANSVYSALAAEWHLIDYLTEHHVLDGFLDRHPLEKLIEDELKLYDFYMTVNMEILKLLESRSSLSGWKVDVSRQDNDPDATLFGADAPQAWMLECHLQAVARLDTRKKDPRDYQATYQGELTLKIENNTSWFDSQFKDKVLMNPQLPFAMVRNFLSTNDHTVIPTRLEKTMSVTNFTIDIISSDGMYSGGFEGEVNRRLLLDKAKSDFVLAHTVEMALEYGAWNNGSLNMPGIAATENIKFAFSSTQVNDSLDPRLLISDQENKGFISLRGVSSMDYSEEVTKVQLVKGTQTVVTDPAVYADLKRKASFRVMPIARTSVQGVPSRKGADDQPEAVQLMSSDNDEYPLQWTDWRSNVRPEYAGFLEGNNHEIPAEYAWLAPDGLKEDDYVEVNNGDVHVDLNGYPETTFQKYVDLFKAHGFTDVQTDDTSFGYRMWEARNAAGNRQCCIVRMGAGKFQVSIEKCLTDEEVMESLLKKAGVDKWQDILKMINE